MQIFFSVLFALLTARVIEWLIVAYVRTLQDKHKKAEAFDKIIKAK